MKRILKFSGGPKRKHWIDMGEVTVNQLLTNASFQFQLEASVNLILVVS